jgi:transposase
MKNIQFYIGVDMADASFTASVLTQPNKPSQLKEQIPNTLDGFFEFEQWLKTFDVASNNAVICLEATGVYGESFSHYFVAKGYNVAVEPPLKVKRAFKQSGHKTDAVDSAQIAEYAYRFYDELSFFNIPSELVQKAELLIKTREHLTKQMTSDKNALQTVKRHVVRAPLAEKSYQNAIETLQNSIKEIDKEIDRLLKQNPRYRQMIETLQSIPGVKTTLPPHLFVLTDGFTKSLSYRSLASYLGICPFERTSGTSLRQKPRSRGFGPPVMRKLLHLAARSVCTHNPVFRSYYLRKQAEGKPPRLVLNNVANKLLKIICAILNSEKQYSRNYKSINPRLLYIA